jgi:hypothetical protein
VREAIVSSCKEPVKERRDRPEEEYEETRPFAFSYLSLSMYRFLRDKRRTLSFARGKLFDRSEGE